MEPVTTAKSLERIADALEALLPILERLATPMIVYQTVPVSAPPVAAPSGYRCAGCGTWIMPGTVHACSGKTWPTTSPPWTGGGGSPNICRTGSDQSSARSEPTMVWNGIPVTVTLT
jgi:hypothetical protein